MQKIRDFNLLMNENLFLKFFQKYANIHKDIIVNALFNFSQ